MKHPERLEIASRRKALQTAWFEAAERSAARKRELAAAFAEIEALPPHLLHLNFAALGSLALAAHRAEAEADKAKAAALAI